jgi:preprotein translocase subunit SecE
MQRGGFSIMKKITWEDWQVVGLIALMVIVAVALAALILTIIFPSR